ncbi:hypothetical protein ZIOFF_048561 [Zingiber officinale]|uniref:DUF295 domain-containing protein n=1 Tax=Zingiber officinale TaxID=94328 RepID=A0A8J5FTI3_ZINOF|nr:hypothetical protein ZIOFF_048561 [Zingiber officinale]
MDGDSHDWSLLPLDLLRLLGEKLELPHRIVFRTVCKSWCSALPSISVPYPWLLLPAEQIDDSCTFLPLPSDNDHHSYFKFSPVSPLHGMCYAGSNGSWVAIVDLAFNISLLNPLTRAQIYLPSLLDIFPCEPLPNCGGYIFHKKVGNSYFLEFETCRDYHIKKVIFSSNPTPNNYMAMVICNGFPSAYTKAGASKWINLDFFTHDIIYYDGLFYAVMGGPSYIIAIDLSGDDPIKRVIIDDDIEFFDSLPICKYHYHYLAFSSTGELFLILRRGEYVYLDPSDDDEDPIKHETIGFMVFKYNCESSSYWDEVRCLGNKSIFIGMNNAYLLSIEDFAGVKANCIYFTDTWEGSRCNADKGRSNLDIGIFDLEQKKFQRYCLPYEITLPPPIWFIPSM